MLTIRLTRKGKKNQPFFQVVVIDKRRSSKGGRAVEILGYVNPLTKKKNLKKERVLYWISKGAKPSATVNNLLIKEKIIEGKKIHVSKISKKRQAKIDTEKLKATPAPASVSSLAPAEAPKTEVTSAEAPEIAPVASASDKSSAGQSGEAKEEKLIESPKE